MWKIFEICRRDPHFVIHQGTERLCFDQYGSDNDEIVLIFDPQLGLQLSGAEDDFF